MAVQNSKVPVRFKHGYVVDKDGNNVPDLTAALTEMVRRCSCGIDCCLGLFTLTHAETGDLMGIYIVEGEIGPEFVIEPYDEALVNVKALYDARTP